MIQPNNFPFFYLCVDTEEKMKQKGENLYVFIERTLASYQILRPIHQRMMAARRVLMMAGWLMAR